MASSGVSIITNYNLSRYQPCFGSWYAFWYTYLLTLADDLILTWSLSSPDYSTNPIAVIIELCLILYNSLEIGPFAVVRNDYSIFLGVLIKIEISKGFSGVAFSRQVNTTHHTKELIRGHQVNYKVCISFVLALLASISTRYMWISWFYFCKKRGVY